MAIRVCAATQERLSVRIAPNQLFLQTLAQFAAACEQKANADPLVGTGAADHE
jgi:hypothetical protein